MANDPKLAQWRAQQQLATMQGGRGGGGAGRSNGGGAAAAEEQKKEAAMEEQRRLMLKQILSDAAGERLSNIRLVKPDKARQVEMLVINAARQGKLGGKVEDEQLKELLAQVSEQTQRRTKVTISRRKSVFDDDDDDDDDDW